MKRYWVEEANEFFEDYPEPGYNKCELFVVDEAMIEKGAYALTGFMKEDSPELRQLHRNMAETVLRAALGRSDV